jgi:mono/diheme cytochrome c family protein
MKRPVLLLSLFAVALVGAGCGGKKADESSATPAPATSPAPAAPAATSPYDSGPRAIDEPVNEALAAQGEQLFQTKICATCHGFGKKITCPDQLGVPRQRTARWMVEQIMHPDVMTKTDPIAKQLLGQYSIQMPNQGITEPQAKALVEFIKKKNLAAGK